MPFDASLAGLVWDTHTHVFGPHDRYPLAAARAYTPPVRWIDTLARTAGAAGIGRIVMVHPSVYGFDLSSLTDALKSGDGRYRAVAVVPPDVSRERLRELHVLGVRGLRFNLVLIGGVGFEGFEQVAGYATDLGWHAQILITPGDLPQVMKLRERTPIPMVFDHFGGFDAATRTDDPAWRTFVDFLRDGNGYVKLSGWYRLSKGGFPWRNMNPLVQALVDAVPDRLLWGSDWPHTWFFERVGERVPEYSETLVPVLGCLTDPVMRQKVLVANAERLYR